jgi:putative addiction module component (TIGR02574 family)
MNQATGTIDFTKLTIDERIALIGRIWDSINADSATIPLTLAQQQELDKRLDEYENSPGAGVPWDEVKKNLLSKQ